MRLRGMIIVENSPCTEHDLRPPTRWTGRAVACQKIPVNPVIFPELSHASIRCMVLHAFSCPCTPCQRQSRRGLSLPLHLHENCPMKRAGVAGRALRANGRHCIDNISLLILLIKCMVKSLRAYPSRRYCRRQFEHSQCTETGTYTQYVRISSSALV